MSLFPESKGAFVQTVGIVRTQIMRRYSTEQCCISVMRLPPLLNTLARWIQRCFRRRGSRAEQTAAQRKGFTLVSPYRSTRHRSCDELFVHLMLTTFPGSLKQFKTTWHYSIAQNSNVLIQSSTHVTSFSETERADLHLVQNCLKTGESLTACMER